jgi:hypothetical protein
MAGQPSALANRKSSVARSVPPSFVTSDITKSYVTALVEKLIKQHQSYRFLPNRCRLPLGRSLMFQEQ